MFTTSGTYLNQIGQSLIKIRQKQKRQKIHFSREFHYRAFQKKKATFHDQNLNDVNIFFLIDGQQPSYEGN